jgi:hypothetical protein
VTDRIGCCIPFCRHTRKNPGRDGICASEWLCRDHWIMLPKARRRVYGRVKKAYRRFHHETDFARACRIWNRLKRQATEIAAGI